MSEPDVSITDSLPTPEKRWYHYLRRAVLLYLLIPYLMVVLIFVFGQRSFLYRPTPSADLSAATLGLDAKFVRDMELTTNDGNTLRGWLWKTSIESESPSPLVLYFPGNSLNRGERRADLQEFVRQGFDVLIFDYRGFGDSSGSPSEVTLTDDAQLIWNFALKQTKQQAERIVIFGESLGGAVALSLWDEQPEPAPGALILNSTFTSMTDTVNHHYPWFPFAFFLWDKWPSDQRINQVRVPVHIFHGTADAMIPVEQGRTLARTATHATFHEIPGQEHNEIPMPLLKQTLQQLREKITNKKSR